MFNFAARNYFNAKNKAISAISDLKTLYNHPTTIIHNKMKKALFAALIMGAAALSMNAQSISWWSSERDGDVVNLGVRAGVNFSNFNGDLDDYDSKVGFNAGLAVDFCLTNSFYVNSGLFYTLKGAKLEEDGEEETITAGFLEIPVYASYRINFGEESQLQVFTGPYIGYGINGKVKYKSEDGKADFDLFGTGDDKAGFKRFEFGWGVGAAYTFSKIYVGLQYQTGLNNLLDKKEWEKGEANFSNFSISVGYNF